eukprot:PhF_6_TR1959/c0_g1_i1/m.3183
MIYLRSKSFHFMSSTSDCVTHSLQENQKRMNNGSGVVILRFKLPHTKANVFETLLTVVKSGRVKPIGSGLAIAKLETENMVYEILRRNLAVAVCTLTANDRGVEWDGDDVQVLDVTTWSQEEVVQIVPAARCYPHWKLESRCILPCNTSVICKDISRKVQSLQDTLWVQPRYSFRAHSMYARGVVQTGISGVEDYSTELNLTGEGEVVGISDTGIDHDHCFFRDSNVHVQYGSLNSNHRKIIRYDSTTQEEGNAKSDYVGGHGTAVAGILAGKPEYYDNQTSPYQGVVPEAKIVFYDLANGPTEKLAVPSDFKTDVLQTAYAAGARVHVNSWGMEGETATYTTYSRDVDLFVYDHPEMLVFFAAGNGADDACLTSPNNVMCGMHTVNSPGTNKNGISVGSSMTTTQSWNSKLMGEYVLSVSKNGTRVMNITLRRSNFGRSQDLRNVTFAMADGDQLGCSGETPMYGSQDRVVYIVRRGTCLFREKIMRSQNAGAIGIIIINNVEGFPNTMNVEQSGDITIGAFTCNLSDGNRLMNLLSELTSKNHNLQGNITYEATPSQYLNKENLSGFSARGPTKPDNRFKPDVVGIGEFIVNARSDGSTSTNNCDMSLQQGTSMSTPLVAGAALIVRQYLRDKKYLGVPIVNPTAALIKAILIQSALPLQGIVDRNGQGAFERLSGVPNDFEGFGRVQLNTTLPMSFDPGMMASSPQLFFDQSTQLASSEVRRYCVFFHHNPNQLAFRATLTWTDYPSSEMAAHHLIADLDLEVVGPHGVRHYGNSESVPDRINNVERVYLSEAKSGYYAVIVRAHSVLNPDGVQKYAMVASGELASGRCQQCESGCSGHGVCDFHTCQCSVGWTSVDCSHRVEDIYADDPFVTVRYVEVDQMSLFALRFPDENDRPNLDTFTVHMVRTDVTNGDPDLFIRVNDYPNIVEGTHDYADTTCDTCQGTQQTTHKLVVPIPGRNRKTYFIGVYGACCVTAHYKLWVTLDEFGRATVPEIWHSSPHTLSMSGGILNLTGDELSPSSSLNELDVYLLPKGTPPEIPAVTSWIPCPYLAAISSKKQISCMVPPDLLPGNYTFRVVISGTVLAPDQVTAMLTILAPPTAAPVDISPVRGLRVKPCSNPRSADCVPTVWKVTFPFAVTARGGGHVYLIGPGIGDEVTTYNRVIHFYDGVTQYPCEVVFSAETQGNQVHCLSSPNLLSNITDTFTIVFHLGSFIPASHGVVRFIQDSPAVLGLSRWNDGKISPGRLWITYYESITTGVRLQINTSNLTKCGTCNGAAQVPTTPQIQIASCSTNLSVLPNQDGALCTTDVPPSVVRGEFQPLEVRVWGYSIPHPANSSFGLTFAQKPKFHSVRNQTGPFFVVQATFNFDDTTDLCLAGTFDTHTYIYVQAYVANSTKPGNATSSKRYVTNRVFPINVTEGVICFPWTGPQTFNYNISFEVNVGGFVIQNSSVVVSFVSIPRVFALSILNTTIRSPTPAQPLIIPASSNGTVLIVLGVFRVPTTELHRIKIVVRNSFECRIITIVSNHTLQCVLSPFAQGSNTTIVFFIDDWIIQIPNALTFTQNQNLTNRLKSIDLGTDPASITASVPTIFVNSMTWPKDFILVLHVGLSCAFADAMYGTSMMRRGMPEPWSVLPDLFLSSNNTRPEIRICGSFDGQAIISSGKAQFFFSELDVRPLILLSNISLKHYVKNVKTYVITKSIFEFEPVVMNRRMKITLKGVNLDPDKMSLRLSCGIKHTETYLPTIDESNSNKSVFDFTLIHDDFERCGDVIHVTAETSPGAFLPLGTLTVQECLLGDGVGVCSNHGACENGMCRCTPPHSGKQCELGCTFAPGSSTVCSGHGVCVGSSCTCEDGYYTQFCNKQSLLMDLSGSSCEFMGDLKTTTEVEDVPHGKHREWVLIEIKLRPDKMGNMSSSHRPRPYFSIHADCSMDGFVWGPYAQNIGKVRSAFVELRSNHTQFHFDVDRIFFGSEEESRTFLGLYPSCENATMNTYVRVYPVERDQLVGGEHYQYTLAPDDPIYRYNYHMNPYVNRFLVDEEEPTGFPTATTVVNGTIIISPGTPPDKVASGSSNQNSGAEIAKGLGIGVGVIIFCGVLVVVFTKYRERKYLQVASPKT